MCCNSIKYCKVWRVLNTLKIEEYRHKWNNGSKFSQIFFLFFLVQQIKILSFISPSQRKWVILFFPFLSFSFNQSPFSISETRVYLSLSFPFPCLFLLLLPFTLFSFPFYFLSKTLPRATFDLPFLLPQSTVPSHSLLFRLNLAIIYIYILWK